MLTVVETHFGHVFIRFSEREKNWQQTLDKFKEVIPRNERVWVEERRLWAIKGGKENLDRLQGLFPDFERKLAFAQAQATLLDEEWEDPFNAM